MRGWTGRRSFDDLHWFVRSEEMYFYFFLFLSCLGFLTSFLRTLLPLPMGGSCWLADSVQFDGAMVVGRRGEVTGGGADKAMRISSLDEYLQIEPLDEPAELEATHAQFPFDAVVECDFP